MLGRFIKRLRLLKKLDSFTDIHSRTLNLIESADLTPTAKQLHNIALDLGIDAMLLISEMYRGVKLDRKNMKIKKLVSRIEALETKLLNEITNDKA